MLQNEKGINHYRLAIYIILELQHRNNNQTPGTPSPAKLIPAMKKALNRGRH